MSDASRIQRLHAAGMTLVLAPAYDEYSAVRPGTNATSGLVTNVSQDASVQRVFEHLPDSGAPSSSLSDSKMNFCVD